MTGVWPFDTIIATKESCIVHDDEEIIQLVNKQSLKALTKSMSESRGKKFYFIILGTYSMLSRYMINAGFVEGEDFINAASFLFDTSGDSPDTYPLVKAM